MFIFSTYSRPLFAVTVFMVCMPALVDTYNSAGDIIDIFSRRYEISVNIRAVAGSFTLLLIWAITWQIVKLVSDTSVLLNGWYLAARFVWGSYLEMPSVSKAPAALIDTQKQVATRQDD